MPVRLSFRGPRRYESSIPRPNVNATLYVDNTFIKTASAVLPPNAKVSVNFDYDFRVAGPHFVRVSVDPDYLDIDDSRYLALDVKSALRGLIIDGDPGTNPTDSAASLPSIVTSTRPGSGPGLTVTVSTRSRSAWAYSVFPAATPAETACCSRPTIAS